MSEFATARLRFAGPAPLPVEASFDGGRLTSDGGLVWLAEAEAEIGVCAAFAAAIPEWRHPARVRHPLGLLVSQRVFQIACGYADQDDADGLRTDPLLKWACGRLPESGADLASQPTLSRLENAVDRKTCDRLGAALLVLYLRERERAGVPGRVLLDCDGFDDPVHGAQEGAAYHGYFGQHQYLPLLVLDGDTGQLAAAVLRPGNSPGSKGAVAVLKRVVRAVRARWPGAAVEVEIRADSGFAVPAVYDFCERAGLTYTVGLVPNPRLEALAAPLLAEAGRQQRESAAEKVRLVGEASYQAESWPHPRRVVYKAEALAKGPDTRFVVTNRTDAPPAVYDRDVDRGEPENRVKDLKRACRADRLSDHRFWANQFRLLLHAAAYGLLDTLRRWLTRLGAARMQLDTRRLRLVKIGGRVLQWLARVRLHLASSHPGQPLWALLASRPDRLVNNPG